ncbi:MAG: hypothetical protein KKI02_07590 [Planctomycetes bacterium]|nr:hypothetical protein [Planctomycetota bacterium]
MLRWGLVAAFAWSAGGKFFWPEQLREILLRTGMVSSDWAALLAYGLPGLELLVALALAAKMLLPLGLLLSTFLSVVFAGMHGYLLISGDLVPCGCAGVAIDFSTWEWHVSLLGLSIAMVLASVALLFSLPPGETRTRTASTVPPGQGAGVADGAGEIATGAEAGSDSSPT